MKTRLAEAMAWFAFKLAWLFVAVVIGLFGILRFVLQKLGAAYHLEGVAYWDWIEMSVAITIALVLYGALVNWVLRRNLPDEGQMGY